MSTIKIGFTGTRMGLTEKQKKYVEEFIREKFNSTSEVHHGDCIGADKDFHDICSTISQNIKIVIHLPNNNKLRAFCQSNYIEKQKPYLQRNKDIVANSDILIACPLSEKEEIRSGTWTTIRYAKKMNKNVCLFV